MGCPESTDSTKPERPIKQIPDPVGPAKDPLQSDIDIIDAIVSDPHINYFQNKI